MTRTSVCAFAWKKNRGRMVAVLALHACLAAPAVAAHVVITEVMVTPTASQFIEIHNTTSKPVDLSNYYLTDASGYLRLPCCPPILPFLDFAVRFPAGTSIAGNGVMVVAFNASSYIAAFGSPPNFEMPLADPPSAAVPDMEIGWGGSISNGRSINSPGEWVVLFTWDQSSDRVRDVDIIRIGNPDFNNMLANKGNQCFDGPDGGTDCDAYLNDALSMPPMALGFAPAGFSHKRRFLEGQREQQCNGNGLENHDETSEFSPVTWDGTAPNAYTAPTPGTVPVFADAPGQCYADVDLSGVIDSDDVVEVVLGWGACPNPIPCTSVCAADVAPLGCRDCSVNADDLVAVILNWGACP